jgi:hypothetical protein
MSAFVPLAVDNRTSSSLPRSRCRALVAIKARARERAENLRAILVELRGAGVRVIAAAHGVSVNTVQRIAHTE